jgi:hypothetical protein
MNCLHVDKTCPIVPATRSISKGVRGTHGLRALCVLGVLCGSCISDVACSAADIRTWAFEATIIHKNDPQKLFDDVRLGDPVTGTFSYDVSLPMDPFSNPPQWADYQHPGWFQGLRMAIENPRTGEEIRYGRQADDFRDWFVSVFKESPYYEPGTSAVAFWETTEDPRPGLSGSIYMEFLGPSILTEISLPTAYDIDDWPSAAIYIDTDNFALGAIAQLHTITPLTPGDFSLDGKVDADDYSLWRSTFGPTGISEADWDRNGSVDAADYVVWRNSAGAMSASNLVAPLAPEPASAPLAIVALMCLSLIRTMRKNRANESACPNVAPVGVRGGGRLPARSPAITNACAINSALKQQTAGLALTTSDSRMQSDTAA